MTDTPRPTQPPSKTDSLLRQKYEEAYINQSELMDKLAQQLITLNLAVPGLYASVLTLVYGGEATLTQNWWLYAVFGCWFISLILTLVAIFPQEWQVDTSRLEGDPDGKPAPDGSISIREFFRESAALKRSLLVPAAVLLSIGIFGAALIVIL